MQPSPFALALIAFNAFACGGSVTISNEGGVSKPTGDAAVVSASDAGDSAVPQQRIAIKFATFKSSSSTDASAWANYGSNIDGLTTNKDSQDVCKRFGGASSSVQSDGTGGIDNSWGHNVMPMFYSVGWAFEGVGYLVIDETGNGSLRLPGKGATMVIPVVLARLDTVGTTSTFSAVIPVEELVSVFKSVAGRISLSLCGGSALETISDQIRTSADIPSTGLQSPSVTCNAISIGAELTGVVDEQSPSVVVEPDPCGH